MQAVKKDVMHGPVLMQHTELRPCFLCMGHSSHQSVSPRTSAKYPSVSGAKT
jgi:hypothetical protein